MPDPDDQVVQVQLVRAATIDGHDHAPGEYVEVTTDLARRLILAGVAQGVPAVQLRPLTADERAMEAYLRDDPDRPLSPAWRRKHAAAGDDLMTRAEDAQAEGDAELAFALSNLASVHYQAAAAGSRQ